MTGKYCEKQDIFIRDSFLTSLNSQHQSFSKSKANHLSHKIFEYM